MSSELKRAVDHAALPSAGAASSGAVAAVAGEHDDTGLSEAEAAARLAAHGPNTLAESERRRWPRIVADAAREPMFVLLLCAALLYLVLGQPAEGLFLCFMVAVSLGLALYNEGRTERAMAALRQLATPRANVRRGGQWRTILAAGLVQGDLIAVHEGERVPADAVLLSASGLQADESLLTGESAPVDKGDQAALFAGALVVQGHGVARVTATGARSQLGVLSASLRAVQPAPSPLQRQSAALARRFAVVGLALSATVAVLYGVLRGDWLQALLAGIALAMSMLPEELPVVMTVFPAIGAWRLARQQVLTRRLSAIDTLGAISVLCVDKTGTLTANRMEVAALYAQGVRHDPRPGQDDLPAWLESLVETAVLASATSGADPIDQAVQRFGERSLPPRRRHRDWAMLHEYGVSAGQRALVHIWRRAGAVAGGTDSGDAGVNAAARAPLMAAAKGAPETIVDWCRMDPAAREAVLAAAAAMARDGLKVLGVAHAGLAGEPWPARPADIGLRFAGLLALADPLRAEIPACLAECRQAGIRVVMITGDHPDTARAIARQAGMAGAADVAGVAGVADMAGVTGIAGAADLPVLTGAALDAMDEAALAARIGQTAICARIAPLQKLRLVQAFVHSGAVVAMTGDGVNDAPALKAAHVGIAMGGRGTDVARAAASLILLDDRFASIVDAIGGGRRIYANMRKSMRYVIAMHAPIAGMAMVPILAGWPPMLYPMHIVFLELIIDPVCSLVFENEPASPALMREPPRDPQAQLFTGPALARALALGVTPLLAVALAYGWALGALDPAPARAFAFVALVLANLSLILAIRADGDDFWTSLLRPNRVLVLVGVAALATLALVLTVPWLARLFQFGGLTPSLAAMAGAIGLASALTPALLFKQRRG